MLSEAQKPVIRDTESNQQALNKYNKYKVKEPLIKLPPQDQNDEFDQ